MNSIQHAKVQIYLIINCVNCKNIIIPIIHTKIIKTIMKNSNTHVKDKVMKVKYTDADEYHNSMN